MTIVSSELTDTAEGDGAEVTARWTPLQKVGFRLLFTIGGGLLLLTVYGNLLLYAVLEPVLWLAAQIGSVLISGHGIEITESAGGDLLWMWCYHLGWIVVAVVITAIWTALDRYRPNYRRLAASLWVFARFALAISMILYGMAKAIPTQMGFMALPDQQLQLVGDTSLFKTLWGFMGASDAYSTATGLVELISGLLLLWNRTWALGALGSVFAMAQVFLLNMTYDVPVKQVSGELLLIAIGVTAPLWPNLVRVAFNSGPTCPVKLWPALGSDRRWLRKTGTVLKFGAASALTVLIIIEGAAVYSTYKTPSSTLDGVWHATAFTIDGREPTWNQVDPAPWPNVAITHRDKVPDYGVVKFVAQTPNGRTSPWMLKVNDDRLELSKHESGPPEQILNVRQPTADLLVLTGEVDGKRIEGTYERRFMERSKSGFRWVQPETDPKSVDAGD